MIIIRYSKMNVYLYITNIQLFPLQAFMDYMLILYIYSFYFN